MSFNKENRIGIEELSITTRGEVNSFAYKSALDAHITNQSRHLSPKDVKELYSAKQFAKDYTDYRFKSIIGNFNFNEIDIDNELDLVNIIIILYKRLVNLVDKDRLTKDQDIADFIETFTYKMDDIARDVQYTVENLNEEFNDIKDLIDTEVENRTKAIKSEEFFRKETDELLDKEFLLFREDMNREISELYERISSESVEHDIALQNFEERFNARLNSFESSYQSVLETYRTYIDDKLTQIASIETALSNLRSDLNNEIQERQAQDLAILNRLP